MNQTSRQHPYLYFNRDWVQRFRSRLSVSDELRGKWEDFVAEADQLLDAVFFDESYADSEDSQHGRYGEPSEQIAVMGMNLGLIYQVTGELRYAEKLKSALLHYGAYRKWFGKGLLRNDPPWHSELNTSRFCFGFAVGYDCVYEMMTDAERLQTRQALVRMGVQPTLEDWVFADTRVHALDSMGHNWWSVMIALAGVGVLAVLDEEPQAHEWLSKIRQIFPEYFTYKGSVLGNKSPNYDNGGAFYESVGYANYGLQEYLAFRAAYQQVYGYTDFSDIPMLERVGEFFLHTTYPSGQRPLTVNFGDSSIYGGAVQSVKLLLANGRDDARLRWYLKEWNKPYTAYDFLFYDRIHGGASLAPEDRSTSVLYPEIGWAIMRTGWQKDATMLAVKSGFTWNHAHADAGSFVLFHQGKPLLIDSGNCSYGRPEYQKYYLQSKAHNVVLFNGQGQSPEDLPRGVKEHGQLYHLIDHEGMRYVYADATGPMSRFFQRNYRHFLWVDGVILVIDDVRAYEEGSIEWLLHYEGKAARDADGGIRIANGESAVTVRPLFPQSLTVLEEEGLADHAPETKVKYFAFRTKATTRQAKFITAYIPDEPAGGQKPAISTFEEHEVLGVCITRNGKQTVVCLNQRADGRIMHRNCIRMLNGWETDAYLTAMTRSVDTDVDDFGAVERCLVVHGSFLRRDGLPLFSSMSRATASMVFKERELSVAIQGQPFIQAQIRPAKLPDTVTVNGSIAHDVVQNGGIVTFCINAEMPARRPG